MEADRTRETAQAYFDRVLNGGDMHAAARLFASGIVFHYPLGELRGADAVTDYIASFRTAFTDVCFTVHALIAEVDRAAARWTLTGIRTGEFRGVAPTGKPVNLPGLTWFEIGAARIREMRVSFDPALLMT